MGSTDVAGPYLVLAEFFLDVVCSDLVAEVSCRALEGVEQVLKCKKAFLM